MKKFLFACNYCKKLKILNYDNVVFLLKNKEALKDFYSRSIG